MDEFSLFIQRLEDKLDRRLDKIDDKMEEMSSTLLRNTVTVEEHKKRSDNLEKRVEQVDARMERHEEASKARSDEIEQSVALFVNFPKYTIRIAKWAGAVASLVAIVWQLISFLKS